MTAVSRGSGRVAANGCMSGGASVDWAIFSKAILANIEIVGLLGRFDFYRR